LNKQPQYEMIFTPLSLSGHHRLSGTLCCWTCWRDCEGSEQNDTPSPVDQLQFYWRDKLVISSIVVDREVTSGIWEKNPLRNVEAKY